MDTIILGMPAWVVIIAAIGVAYYLYKYTTILQSFGIGATQVIPTTAAPVVSTFENVAAKVPKAIIYNFNTSWCGYSVNFQPTWDEFSKELNSTKPSSEVVAVDMKCDDNANRDMCMKWDIRGFPTIIKVVTDGTVDAQGNPNGKKVELDGPRTVEGLKALAAK